MQKKTLLNGQKLQITIKRLCHQLIENHTNFNDTVIIGIQPRGTFLANRIVNELQKQKLTFMPKQITETQKAFEQKKREMQGLQTQIAATDQEINGLVYKLYELTDDEIALVEKS